MATDSEKRVNGCSDFSGVMDKLCGGCTKVSCPAHSEYDVRKSGDDANLGDGDAGAPG